MPEIIRLYIVTNNPEQALAQTLACATTNAPAWARVLSDPEDILKLPNGAKCIAVWFTGRKSLCEAEKAWRERRFMGGIVGLDDRDLVKIDEWIARNRTNILTSDIPKENADIPKPITSAPEIRNLVQTQRWT